MSVVGMLYPGEIPRAVLVIEEGANILSNILLTAVSSSTWRVSCADAYIGYAFAEVEET